MQEWEREKEREKRIPFRCDLSCLVSVWHLGLVSPLLLGMLVPPTSPIFLVHFPISHSPDFSALTPTLTSVSAPHSNTCSLLCLFKTSPSLSFSLTSRFHYQCLCFTSFDLIFNNIFTNIYEKILLSSNGHSTTLQLLQLRIDHIYFGGGCLTWTCD